MAVKTPDNLLVLQVDNYAEFCLRLKFRKVFKETLRSIQRNSQRSSKKLREFFMKTPRSLQRNSYFGCIAIASTNHEGGSQRRPQDAERIWISTWGREWTHEHSQLSSNRSVRPVKMPIQFNFDKRFKIPTMSFASVGQCRVVKSLKKVQDSHHRVERLTP